MPRTARKQSQTGIYHVMSRGVEKRQIFMDDDDRRSYLNILAEAKKRFMIILHSWCLMPNHVHLLVQDEQGSLSEAMKFINGTYARRFNEKYARVGALFQGRFKSSPVEDDGYLLTVVAYIHDNPVKAGLGSRNSYLWSSYRDYLVQKPRQITDTAFVLELLDKRYIPEVGLLQYGDTQFDDEGLLDPHLAASADIALILLGYEGLDFMECPKQKRNEAILLLRRQGYTVRQIAEAIGVSPSTVSRVCKN